ncbi:hypothetical protein [Nocardia wallacei]|uniref:hypothetical protein n=1 Tax=Nocardia wallacei TaxID=480035 RepID=UPI0024539935|nr:hypothetical protein [Nocardia wallacei]
MSGENAEQQAARGRRLELRVIGSEAAGKEFLELLETGGFDVTRSGTRQSRDGKSLLFYARVRWSQ